MVLLDPSVGEGFPTLVRRFSPLVTAVLSRKEYAIVEQDFGLSSDPLPWPEEGDKLFIPAEDWWHNACLGYAFDDWELYVGGYRRATEVLVDHIKGTRSELDTLIFPIVFLYRQYIELRLKRLIAHGRVLLDEKSGFRKTHRLDALWDDCRRILIEVESEASVANLDAIDAAIQEFCRIDPTSTSFRYPIDKDGDRSLPPDLKYINVRNLGEVMEKIANLLDGAAMMLSVYVDDKRDMEAEWRRAFGGLI